MPSNENVSKKNKEIQKRPVIFPQELSCADVNNSAHSN